jgi:hypothetical protein
LAEFEAGGKDGLPSFTGYSHLGRKYLYFGWDKADGIDHYDEESE